MPRAIPKADVSSRIAHAPLPWYSSEAPIPVIVTALGVFFGALVIWEGSRGGAPWLAVLLGLVTFAALAGLAVLFKHSLRQRLWRRLRSQRNTTAPDVAFTPELRHSIAILIKSPAAAIQRAKCADAWEAFRAECARLGTDPPRTIIDSNLIHRLAVIERPHYGMEPESILDSGDTSRSMVWLMPAGFAIAGVVLLRNQHLLSGLCALGVAGFSLITSHPQLRDRFRIFRWDDGNLIAGMGAIKVQFGRVWTVDNALMVVQTKERAGALFVHFAGEVGRLELSFVDERDPDFIKLWQRWNHPEPRPDLLVQDHL